jgi:hypothetical protein
MVDNAPLLHDGFVTHGCAMCPAGKFAAQTGQTSCRQCPQGRTTSNKGALTCGVVGNSPPTPHPTHLFEDDDDDDDDKREKDFVSLADLDFNIKPTVSHSS